MSEAGTVARSDTPRSHSILEMSCDEARAFLLKQESYCHLDMPPYFQFNGLLDGVAEVLDGKRLSDFQSNSQSPKDFDDVDHLILNNKDGQYAWRPIEIIHPALYVSLVNRITETDHWNQILERFDGFSNNDKIKCLSLPVESLTEEKNKAEQISHWWHVVEQKSIELALDYEFVINTDITNCYAAIYTHSVAWALHTKSKAKEKRRCNSLLGNIIDNHIQDMRHGQTNGIPQGSVLMDFIAEMVLGYADTELTKKITDQEIEDYHILRYRDDCRIFVNNSQDGERILKSLTEVMIGLGLKLHHAKTLASSEIIRASIKDEKRSWISRKQYEKNLQKHLLIIHDHSTAYPNAGSLVKSLGEFQKRLSGLSKCDQSLPLISIVVDIACRNPKTYPMCAAILSKLLSFLDSNEARQCVIKRIKNKFSLIPNTGHIQIWLQRITLPFAPDTEFDEPLCRLVSGCDESIWNNEWISSKDLKNALDAKQIVDEDRVAKLAPIVPAEEVELFISKAEDY